MEGIDRWDYVHHSKINLNYWTSVEGNTTLVECVGTGKF